MTRTMSEKQLETLFADPVAQKLLATTIPARLAYTGVDGAPRVVPIGRWWTGRQLEIATIPRSAKVAALRRDPRVAVTIDTDGLPPKVLARVLRFERARRLLQRPDRPALADVAAVCGFYDQAHLNRDWRELAGCSPTTWLAEELPSVQDDGVAVGAS